LSPRRSRLVAAAVLLAQLLIVAAQTPDRAAEGGGATSLLAGAWLRAVAPLARGVAAAGELAEAAGKSVRTRGQLAEENLRLRRELVELRRERLRLGGLELEVDALARALDYARESGQELRVAEVVYLDRISWLRTMVLRVGARGARRDDVVVSENGVVGRVVEARGEYAEVQLLTDSAAAIGVMLEQARRQGIARGAGPQALELEYVPRQATVEVGDRVLTAGFDGVYPRGLPVGVVSEVEAGSEMFHRIRVRPAVDLAELSTVYLLARPGTPPRGASESGDGGR